MSSGNQNTVHPSFLATVMMYVAFIFFSSSATTKANDNGNVKNLKLTQESEQRYTPSSPFFTIFQSTTLLCTALRRSRKNIPSDKLLS